MPEELQIKMFGDVLRLRRERGQSGDNLLSVTADRGVIRQAESGRRNISSDDKSGYWRVRPGDIVYNTMRMWQGVSGVSHLSGIVSPAYTVCEPLPGVEPRFLARVLKHPAQISGFRAWSQGLVSDTWNLKFSTFSKLPFLLPTRGEQERIAEILDSVDESIRTIEHLIAKYEKAELGVLRQLLEPQERWMQAKVSEVGEVRLGRQRSPEHEHGPHMRPYLRVANVFDGMIDYSDVLNMNFSPVEQLTYGLQPGDLLLNEGQSLELVGRCAIYDGAPGKFCYQNTLVRFRPSPTLLSEFAYYTFKWWRIIGRFAAIAKQTTSIAHLGGDRFACMAMDVPPLDLQQRIVGVLGGSRAQRQAAMGQLDKLRNLKRGLTDDLLTGRVRVPTGEGVAA